MTYQTRRAWSQNDCATIEIENASFFLSLHRNPCGVNSSNLCLNHAIGLCHFFLNGPKKKKSILESRLAVGTELLHFFARRILEEWMKHDVVEKSKA